jgi:hypothetical protein
MGIAELYRTLQPEHRRGDRGLQPAPGDLESVAFLYTMGATAGRIEDFWNNGCLRAQEMTIFGFMIVRREVFLAISLTIGASKLALPQTATNSTPQPSISETSQQFDRMQSLSQQLHQSTMMMSGKAKSIVPVFVAIPEFRKATENFRAAVGDNADLRSPVREIEKLFKPFYDYFDDLSLKPDPVNALDFKDFSGKEIVWETLTTAERIDNNLQLSLRLLRESERSGAISFQTMVFLNDIQKDMARFKLLAERVSAIRRLTD